MKRNFSQLWELGLCSALHALLGTEREGQRQLGGGTGTQRRRFCVRLQPPEVQRSQLRARNKVSPQVQCASAELTTQPDRTDDRGGLEVLHAGAWQVSISRPSTAEGELVRPEQRACTGGSTVNFALQRRAEWVVGERPLCA